MAERVLVLGSTGTTGRRLVRLLRGRDVHVVEAVRRVDAPGKVQFEWDDHKTFAPALIDVNAVYVVAPTDRIEQLPVMQPFLELAAERLDGQIVLLSAAALSAGGPMMGAAHAWLRDHAPRWIALRPSWFMQNFVGQHLRSIRDEGAIYSATGNGRVPFIDAADIAAVAATILTTPSRTSGELVLTGPAALTYSEVATMISRVSGLAICHRPLSVPALAERFRLSGLPREYADLLAEMDGQIAREAHALENDIVSQVTGHPPTTFSAFLMASQCFSNQSAA